MIVKGIRKIPPLEIWLNRNYNFRENNPESLVIEKRLRIQIFKRRFL